MEEVEKELKTLELQLQRCIDQLTTNGKTLDRLRHLMEGNGEGGLMTKVALLESKEKARLWWTRTALAIALTAIAGVLANAYWVTRC